MFDACKKRIQIDIIEYFKEILVHGNDEKIKELSRNLSFSVQQY